MSGFAKAGVALGLIGLTGLAGVRSSNHAAQRARDAEAARQAAAVLEAKQAKLAEAAHAEMAAIKGDPQRYVGRLAPLVPNAERQALLAVAKAVDLHPVNVLATLQENRLSEMRYQVAFPEKPATTKAERFNKMRVLLEASPSGRSLATRVYGNPQFTPHIMPYYSPGEPYPRAPASTGPSSVPKGQQQRGSLRVRQRR